jgi:hypothetical protein
MSGNDEIRMTNVEGMTNDEARIAQRFGHWGFIINSSFVIRHSSFSS